MERDGDRGGRLLLAGLAALALGAPAQAQSPGPLSRSHADLEGPLACSKCHSGGFGVPDDKCLSCHAHQGLRDRIQAKKGFHASKSVRGKPCRDCHGEHKPGRASGGRRETTIDWRPFGGKRNFNHELAGWPLQGAHRFPKCEKCHTATYPKTGHASYLGLSPDCGRCHYGGKDDHGVGGPNPHRFSDPALTDCGICHTTSDRTVPSLRKTKFDHDRTRFALEGRHKRKKCIACHKEDLTRFQVKADFRDCRGCHEDPHRSVISHEKRCASCHSPKVKFKKTVFDHGKKTGFPLRGQHKKNRCSDCHKMGTKAAKPDRACASCHKNVHGKRFGAERCEGCHVEQGWKRIQYDHNAKTKFPLQGVHATAKCGSCHRFGIAEKFERFETSDCSSCHKHKNAHCGQFGDQDCVRCHVQGGDRTSKFDHEATRLSLQDGHEKVACLRCHKPTGSRKKKCREDIQYSGLDFRCGACHDDLHEGRLGEDCLRCHQSGKSFESLVFDHDRDAAFSLSGFHSLVACADCHPARRFKTEQQRCADCHQKDDAHDGRLGDDCGRCHETSGGAPKFDHAVHTRFATTGTHARIECARCHFLLPDSKKSPFAAGDDAAAKSVEAPPPPVIQGEVGLPLDLLFRSAGKDCARCHENPHGVQALLSCEACHGTEKWTALSEDRVHQRGGLALDGAHRSVRCETCHLGTENLLGDMDACGSCHASDDVHIGALGPSCDRCHGQSAWLPSSFTHTEVGFILQGVHRTLDCRSCHLVGNYFIDGSCFSCHLDDYRSAEWHQALDVAQNVEGSGKFYITGGAQGLETRDCDRCHNQFSFSLAVSVEPR